MSDRKTQVNGPAHRPASSAPTPGAARPVVAPWSTRRSLVIFAAATAIGGWLLAPSGEVGATPPPPLPVAPQVVVDAGVAPQAPLATATILVNVVPPVQATVSWGKKKLGRITPTQPLTIVRPRDSGPLDLVVRADGFLPVHTRAHTFSDTKLLVKLTPLDQTSTLLGYRVPLDAGVPLDALPADASVDPGFPPPTVETGSWP